MVEGEGPRRSTLWLSNALSLGMLDPALELCRLRVERIGDLERARELALEARSAVGHEQAAAVFSAVLTLQVVVARETVLIGPGDRVLVGQYRGPRLEPGTVSLPEDADLAWYLVSVELAEE